MHFLNQVLLSRQTTSFESQRSHSNVSFVLRKIFRGLGEKFEKPAAQSTPLEGLYDMVLAPGRRSFIIIKKLKIAKVRRLLGLTDFETIIQTYFLYKLLQFNRGFLVVETDTKIKNMRSLGLRGPAYPPLSSS